MQPERSFLAPFGSPSVFSQGDVTAVRSQDLPRMAPGVLPFRSGAVEKTQDVEPFVRW